MGHYEVSSAIAFLLPIKAHMTNCCIVGRCPEALRNNLESIGLTVTSITESFDFQGRARQNVSCCSDIKYDLLVFLYFPASFVDNNKLIDYFKLYLAQNASIAVLYSPNESDSILPPKITGVINKIIFIRKALSLVRSFPVSHYHHVSAYPSLKVPFAVMDNSKPLAFDFFKELLGKFFWGSSPFWRYSINIIIYLKLVKYFVGEPLIIGEINVEV